MKKTFTLIFFLFLIQTQFIAQTCGSQLLCSQSDVDNMNCSIINGFALIGHSNPAVCGGSTNINNLSNFSSVTFIKDGLQVYDNPNLTSLNGLGNVTQIGDNPDDHILFEQNTSLTDISAINNVTTFTAKALSFMNNGFTTITLPTNFTSLAGSGVSITIKDESNLTTIDYNNLTTVNGALNIQNCANLTSVTGTSISSVGNLTVENCASLASLNFSGITTAGNISLKNNVSSLNSVNFTNLTEFGTLQIDNSGFSNLSDFSPVTSLLADLKLTQNQNLTSLDGLDNITSISGDVSINNNPNLNDCCAILDLINSGGISGNISLYSNGANCNSIAAIQAACPATPMLPQIGTDIDGEAAGDESGISVSMSNDGSRLAIGAFANDGNGSNSGHVRVYSENNGTWTQVGSDIDGEAAEDQFGISVSLSSDGTRLAVGAHTNDGNGSNSGHVRIYLESGGIWTQIGNDINGEASGDESGRSVSLSADGTRVAIGANGNDDNGSSAGHVRVYEENSGTWTQVGSDIDGEAAEDNSGISVSLSSDGTRLAIGASTNDGNGSNSGHVRVYEDMSGTWTQIGSDIDGEAAGDQFGISVSLSSNGTRVAIGGNTNDSNGSNSGHVQVYSESGGVWTQVGGDIEGEAVDDQLGRSVSLSADGTRVAIGANGNDGNGSNSGQARLYQESGGTWTQIENDIDGEAADDNSGIFVSLSPDGSRVAIGATGNDGNGSSAGHVRVYSSQVLPVELINFKGIRKGTEVLLNWKTASEINNEGFEVQWAAGSLQSTEWRNIGFVNGNGNSNTLQSYSYQHQNPESGINYYRLRQIDFDGNFEYSNIVSVDIRNEHSTPSISIYPNPNDGQFQIQLHNPKEQPYHLQLFDSKGVVIVGQFLEDDYLELETILPKGVYWVKAQFYGEVLMEKVVVH